MITTLPNLSYSPTGFSWSEGPHSSAYTKQQAHPRTDLTHFISWDEFETEIHQAITTRMNDMNIPQLSSLSDARYDIGSMPKKKQIVSNEEDVRGEAKVQLHDLVVEVLELLGIEGRFVRSDSGRNEIVGEPDFSWFREPARHGPKVVAEYTTTWAAPLEDLPGYFRRNPSDRSVLERQSIDAVYQVYGYMTFNECKYGVLSNLQRAWFFQRVETDDGRGQTLKYYGPIDIGIDSAGSPSMLKAFVGIILLAENSWFHSSPTPDEAPPGGYFGTSPTAIRERDAAIEQARYYRSTIIAGGSYQVLQLDPRLCHFNRTSVRHAPQRGCTVKATLGGSTREDVFCKIIDLFQRGDSLNALDQEVRNYATLNDLQGVVIPKVCGYYDVWGLLRLLALQDVGTAIPEDGPIDAWTRTKMKAALSRIHSAGYVHGDIARRNFCEKGNVVFLVDFETLSPGSPVQMAAELAAIDAL